MKKILYSIAVILTFNFSLHAQAIFANAFGDPASPALVFIHDGPGKNAVSFEISAAKKLSESGFLIATYDQRGSGRSKYDSITDRYKFTMAFKDLNVLTITRDSLKKPIFIGHGWGATVAIMYARAYPDRVGGLILLSAPVNYQSMFKTILKEAEVIARSNKDSISLKEINAIKKIDTNKLEYQARIQQLSFNLKLHEPLSSNADRDLVIEEMKKNKKFPITEKIRIPPMQGFFSNERYSLLDMEYDIKKCIDAGIPVMAIYGTNDRIIDEKHRNRMKSIVGGANFAEIPNCGHEPYIDQRDKFIEMIKGAYNKIKTQNETTEAIKAQQNKKKKK